MSTYRYIKSLFTKILKASSDIEGRLYLCPKYGVEINFEQLGEVIEDAVKTVPGQKYPLALMMPPRSIASFTEKNGEWEEYRIVMFFLTTTFYNGVGQVKALNSNTQTSTRPITEDWVQMRRAAVEFLNVLKKVEKRDSLQNFAFRLDPGRKVIDPISNVGVDRASGVRLEFAASLFTGCDLQTYTDQSIQNINTGDL